MTSRIDLHEALRRPSFDHAVFCTFGFQADFFEGYCLEKFEALEANNDVVVLMDGLEFDQLLDGPDAVRPRQANLRYLLHPVRPIGRFHSKLFLLTAPKRAVLIVGSGNLTKPGLTRNAELALVTRFEAGRLEWTAGLFRSAVAFLHGVEQMWPSRELRSSLADLNTTAPWLQAPAADAPDRLRLLHNLEEPLLDQICDGLVAPVERVMVVSPFFDPKPNLVDELRERLNPAHIELYTENGATTMTENWVRHPALGDSIRFCTWSDDGHYQPLHAKAIALVTRAGVRLAFGSANFTRAGLLSTPDSGNVETMVVMDRQMSASDLSALFDPCRSAHTDTLRYVVRPTVRRPSAATVSVTEVSLENGRLVVVLSGPDVDRAVAVLSFADGAEARVTLTRRGSGWEAPMSEDLRDRCDRGSTRVRIEGSVGSEQVRSALALLINLKDLATGASAARERRIRDAVRSAEQFANAVADLIRRGSLDALQEFLTFCDIPLGGPADAFSTLRPRDAVADLRRELQSLGARNIREYADLHDAAVSFCERHLRRLARHAKSPVLDSVSGAMHVARAVAHVLLMQCERLVGGLESGPVLTVDDWFAHRTRLDEYLLAYRELMFVVDGLLRRLRTVYAEGAVDEAIRPDLSPLGDIRLVIAKIERRIDTARKARFRVRTLRGDLVTPIVQGNLISPASWRGYLRDIRESTSWLGDWTDPDTTPIAPRASA